MNKKTNTMKSHWKHYRRVATLTCLWVFGLLAVAQAQLPTVTVRFANPVYVCETGQYCVDVEFQADTDSLELFGMNVRFFYDDEILEFAELTDFEGGYDLAAPIPPTVTMGPMGIGFDLFGFGAPGTGTADFVNGAIQLMDPMADPIYISTTGWTRLYRACFIIDDLDPDSLNFCPPLVWDLEQNPANGGWLVGDDGVVITVVDPDPMIESSPVTENVEQFNWQYIGNGAPPYGEPIEVSCISLFCTPTIVCPADVTVQCSDDTTPTGTGTATADEVCESAITIEYEDTVTPSTICTQTYTISRLWIATNTCDEADSCTQIITVIDTISPVVTCPPFITIECTDSTDPQFTGMATATDNCDTVPDITFIDVTVAGDCPQEYTIDRIWIVTDECGNGNSLCRQEITIVDSQPPVLTCPADLTIECSDPIPTDIAGATDACGGEVTVTYEDIGCENPIIGFSGNYEFANWTIINPDGGSVTPMGNMEVMLESPDGPVPCATGASVLFQIVVPATGQLVFDWNYESFDVNGPLYDPFGYNLNGTFFQLTDDNGADIQSGTASVAVTAGDIFAFEQNSIDCILGVGATTVVEFFACEEQEAPICTELIIRTHTAIDECGNSASCVQTILRVDTTVPTITCPADVTIECDEDTLPANTGVATASDNCDAFIPDTWINEIHYDNSGTDVGEFIEVAGISGTDLSNYSLVLYNGANGLVYNTMALSGTIDDESNGIGAISFPYPANGIQNGAPDGMALVEGGTNVIQFLSYEGTFMAADGPAAGMSSTDIGVSENGSEPVGQSLGLTGSGNTYSEFAWSGPSAESPGSLNPGQTIDELTVTGPEITYVDVVVPSTVCPQEFTINRTWTATDNCGNTSSCLQVITVDDSIAPVITCPSDTTFQCSDMAVGAAITYTDEAAFLADNPGVNLESFENNPVGLTSSIVTVPFTLNLLPTGGSNGVYDAPFGGSVATDGVQFVRYQSDAGGTATFLFNAPINTFGLYITDWGDFGMGELTFMNDAGDQFTVAVTPMGDGSIQFFGVYNASMAFNQVVFTNTVPGDAYGFDEVYFGLQLETGVATATDNCDTAPVIDYTDVVIEGECPQEYTVERTWSATDACGNSSTCLQIISVIDTIAPIIVCPADSIAVCDGDNSPESMGFATATDDCDTAPIVDWTDATVAGECPQEYTITRTWSATDACGNVATCDQIIMVVDTVPPTFNPLCQLVLDYFTSDTSDCPADATISLVIGQIVGEDETWTVGGNEIESLDGCLFDNCTNPDSLVARVDDIVITGDECVRTFTVTFTILDQCGNESVEQFVCVVNIIDNVAPVITCPADLTIECDESTEPANTGEATATDDCQDVGITYSDAITPSTVCPQAYIITRTWVADDSCGNVSSCTQIINVADTTPPVIACPADTIVACDGDTDVDATGMATAVDNCDTLVTIAFVEVIIDGECPQEFTIERTWSATDDCGNSSTCLQIISVVDTVAPVVFCPIDITIDCEESTDPENTGFAGAEDNCGVELTIEYADSILQVFCPEVIQRTWSATDECGNVGTCVQLITRDDTTPPMIICPNDTLVVCAEDIPEVLTGGVTTSDNCGFVTVTHEGDFVSDSTCVNRFIVSRVYMATDECGNTATCAQTITVFDDVPPVATCPADLTVTCAEDVPDPDVTAVTATDNCLMGDVVITHGGDVITSQICVNQFTVVRTYIATDACGNSSTCAQTITVFDDVAPTVTCPANITVECNEDVPVPDPTTVTAVDNCATGAVTVTFVSDVISNQTCPNNYTLTRTYLATDACGNSATCAQIITVQDLVAPMITCPPDLTIFFGDDESPENTGEADATDNCASGATTDFADEIIPGPCEEEYTIIRTWTATDSCGNTATCVQEIFVDGMCIIDLALTKTLIPSGPVEGGDDLTFIITVVNEGEVTIGAVEITDYIPVGFALNDPDWTPGNAGSTGISASILLSIANGGLDANGLVPGESVQITITIRADEDVAPGVYFNCAETSNIFDLGGNNIGADEFDSTPDNDNTNDLPGEDDFDCAQICVLPDVVITGDGYVCPESTTTYTVSDYNPEWTYNWSLTGGGTIVDDNGETISIEWDAEPGGPFQISVTVILGDDCSTTAFFNVYIQGVETLSCNDHVQISLDDSCQAVVLSGIILEGEAEGNNTYYVIIIDQNGDTIPNATLTGEHVGQTFTVHVVNECNEQSCWGTISVEDKIPPVIECADATVECGDSTEPIFEPPVMGTTVTSVLPALPIGPGAGVITNALITADVPAGAVIQDVNVTVDLDHTWSADLTAELISPNGTVVLLADQICGTADNWDNVRFDDEAGIDVTAACNPMPPPAILAGDVRPQGLLSDFDGEVATGDWILRITDNVGGDGGTLNLVDLEITFMVPLPYAPVASDACGDVVLTWVDTESGEACEDQLITRVWTATDPNGNTATCVQEITIVPLTLENVEFPLAYEGNCDGSTHPSVTGWPTVNGNPITDEENICNIYVGYWDKELNECGGGQKIVRTWTVLDWCTTEFVEAVQVIKLTDNEGPELTCPDDLTVGTDFWYCYANVSVPKPIAVDDCSEVTSYSLASSSGTIVAFGNNYVINGLELGTHTVTWTVADECGNSSTCSFTITVIDDVVPVANCDAHTIVTLTNDGPQGVTLVPASVFDDGSYDNCGPVTFRARRMDSCIDFDWTTEGACIDDIPGGIPPVNSRDRGTVHRPCVPFACCDVGAGPIMVELEVTDAAGNINYCMVEVEVQDKLSPFVECPPDIIVSCDFWFNVEEGTFVDIEGNNDGSLDEDPLSAVFGNMYDAFRYDESIRGNIVINDPGNDEYPQPYNWGLEGWADDNCEVNLQVRVRVIDDCSGDDLPANAPAGAIKLIERRFSAADGNEGVAPGTCTQRIWVVDYDPFYISDTNCNNQDRNDGVIWPCDVTLDDCPEDLGDTGEPTIFDDACSLIGVTYNDTRFDFVDGACFKILREWSVIDWCQYDPTTGEGLWKYVQVIKVHDEDGPLFVEPCDDVTLCVADEGISLPDNNQAFVGEDDPDATSCSVHVALSRVVDDNCAGAVQYDVKIYPFNGTEYILVQPTTTAAVDSNGLATLTFDTRQSTIQAIRENGLPYNSPWCGDYHRILWSAEDGCGNWSHCEYLFRLEDCKQPSPVCINGLSTVVMPIGGQVTIWAKDFNASSFDDCTPAADLLYSFSGDAYQPSMTYDCDNIPAFNVELSVQIWVADGGTDDNCNGQISWEERNKDFCNTTIVFTDNADVCDGSGPIVGGDIHTEEVEPVENVSVTLTSPGQVFPTYVTVQDGHYVFNGLTLGADYTIHTERNDDHKNGVSTLDLVRIQKHLLGTEEFTSPYQYIAADANNSESVSAIDLVELRRLILGLYVELPNNKSWRFVEKGFPMSMDMVWPFNEQIQIPGLATDSLMHNDFMAVKVGDVNGTAKANAQQVLPRNGRRILNVQLDAPETVEAGELVEVVLTVPEAVEGFQWTLRTDGLVFAGAAGDAFELNDNHIGFLNEETLTMSWNEMRSQANAGGSIVLTFTATRSGQVAEMIRMTSDVTEAEAYTFAGEILDVALTSRTTEAEFALYQNQPNPWNGQTTIGFVLPADASATLTIFDVTGKVIRSFEGDYKAGYNTILLSSRELSATGIMYYRLESGEYSASKKMVVLE